GRTARRRHASAEERGQTCIECHKGVAHDQPLKPR
ncbi:MAG: NapC/NirT family cytochrome c, partial [Halochromatium sp.]